MTISHDVLRKIKFLEDIQGERPQTITLHPQDFADLLIEASPGDRYEPERTWELAGITVFTDPCQTRLRRT